MGDNATTIPSELMKEMHEAAKLAAAGTSSREQMREACEQMDRIRAEVFKRNGTLDIGTPAIRELRDE